MQHNETKQAQAEPQPFVYRDDDPRNERVASVIVNGLGNLREAIFVKSVLASKWDDLSWDERAEYVAKMALLNHRADSAMRDLITGVE